MRVSAALPGNVLPPVRDVPRARAHGSTGWAAFHTVAPTESCIFQTSNVSPAFKAFQRLLNKEHLHAAQPLTCSSTLPAGLRKPQPLVPTPALPPHSHQFRQMSFHPGSWAGARIWLKPRHQELVLAWLVSSIWYAVWLHQPGISNRKIFRKLQLKPEWRRQGRTGTKHHGPQAACSRGVKAARGAERKPGPAP